MDKEEDILQYVKSKTIWHILIIFVILNRMNKKIISVIAAIIMLGALYVLSNNTKTKTKTPLSTPQQEATTTIQTETAKSTTSTSTSISHEWHFSAHEDPDGMNRTDVSLTVNNENHILGTYDGACFLVAPDKTGITGEFADPNEIDRAQCYFAGGGNEIGLFKEGDTILVKVGELSEGSMEDAPFRGNFKTVFEFNTGIL